MISKEKLEDYYHRALKGDGIAQYQLGLAYSTGDIGGRCDYVSAHQWFNIAASFGIKGAKKHREDIASVMEKRDIEKAQAYARKIFVSIESGLSKRGI